MRPLSREPHEFYRTFLSQTKSATMLEKSDCDDWSELKWERWRLHVRAECAVGGQALTKAFAEAFGPVTRSRTKSGATGNRAADVLARAKRIVADGLRDQNTRRRKSASVARAEEREFAKTDTVHWGTRW
jgi:hypothetical protein